MAYTPTHPRWQPLPAGGTLISAVALNEMDDGITNVSSQADQLQTQINYTNQNVSDLSAEVAQIAAGQQGVANGTGGAVSSVAGRTGAVILTKSDVGLSQVDNTSDVNKPLSTAAQSALNAKAGLASPAFTGQPTAPTGTTARTTQVATQAYAMAYADTAAAAANSHSDGVAATKAPLDSPTFTGIVGGVTKSMVGLGNVDNNSDATSFNNFGVYPTLYYTGTTWTGRNLPAGYSGPVIWNSELYANISGPTAAVANDRWARKRSTS